eukprot:7653235-Pyramimonas_sp.AAC.1
MLLGGTTTGTTTNGMIMVYIGEKMIGIAQIGMTHVGKATITRRTSHLTETHAKAVKVVKYVADVMDEGVPNAARNGIHTHDCPAKDDAQDSKQQGEHRHDKGLPCSKGHGGKTENKGQIKGNNNRDKKGDNRHGWGSNRDRNRNGKGKKKHR